MTPDGLQRRGYSVAAMRALARRRLPRMVFDFADGGAEEERTLRANEQAFADLVIVPKPLSGRESTDQSIELFGDKLASPVLLGPTGLAGAYWPRGEVEEARAAAAGGTVFTMSHASTVAMEELAREAPGNNWMQTYIYRDRGMSQAFAERAKAAGFRVLVLSVDNQVLGQRERDLRNGFTVPPKIGPRTILDMALHAGWLLRMREARHITFANYAQPGERGQDIVSLGAYMATMLDPAATWRDVAWLRGLWQGPLVLKGILHPDEAREAVAIGADAVIVSNHGGRQLDGAIASLDALPGVVGAVQGAIPVLLDGGVRRGADVVKAIALGATACLIGRPALWGLAVAGQAGVVQILDIFRREIDRVLTLSGIEDIKQLHGNNGLTLYRRPG
ncbi:MAG: alpha-hydroxy-acid oxidizing protein [Alphaproteobacteria bacterium]|nr:alpha-hydroxy-acid oxidizing protein [Alphaproteobacteria bacterium]